MASKGVLSNYKKLIVLRYVCMYLISLTFGCAVTGFALTMHEIWPHF